MMKTYYLMIVGLLGLAACAPAMQLAWVRADASPEKAEEQQNACIFQIVNVPLTANCAPPSPTDIDYKLGYCMRGQGYKLVSVPVKS